MDFTVDRTALVNELAIIRNAVEKKNTIPVLAFALFEVSGDTLKITGTDLDVTIITSVPVKGKAGSFCVPALQLFNLLRLFDQDEVSFKLEKNERVKVQCGESKHLLPTMKRDQFPAVDKTEKGETLTMPADVLGEMVKAALLTVSTDVNDHRAHCVSLNLCAADGVLDITSTTEKHLLNASYATPEKVGFDVMLPRRAAQVLTAFVGGEKIVMEVSEKHATFTAVHRTLIARLGFGKFVAWRVMISDVEGHKARIDVGEFRAALKRASVTVDNSFSFRAFKCEFSKAALTIESKETESGKSTEPIAASCPTLNGDKYEVTISGNQVLDFLGLVEGDGVFCEMFPPKVTTKDDGTKTEWPRALRFTPSVQGAFNYQYFTQPVRPDA